MGRRVVGVTAISILLAYFAVPTPTFAADATCRTSDIQRSGSYFTEYESVDYSSDGYLVVHFQNASTTERLVTLGTIFYDDDCSRIWSLGNTWLGSFDYPPLVIPGGVTEWSVRFTSSTHFQVWDDANHGILMEVNTPVELPEYATISFALSLSQFNNNESLFSRGYKIKQNGAPPAVEHSLDPSISPCSAMAGVGYFFDLGYEHAEYVDGLLSIHLRRAMESNGPFYANVFAFNGEESCDQAVAGSYITGPSTVPPTNLRSWSRYYSIRMTSPTHWVFWDDEKNEQVFCDHCQGTVPEGTPYIFFYAQQANVTSKIRTTMYPPAQQGCTENCNSNVMFLPGLQASRLYAPGLIGENKIWEPDSLLGNDVPLLDMNNLAAKDNVYAKEGGVIDYAYGGFSIYSPFILQMQSLKVGDVFEDWKAVAYDWRLDYEDLLSMGHETADGKIYYRGANSATSTPYIIQELKNLASTSRTGKVTIIAHSNGGLLAKALLMQPGMSQYVDKLVLVASPQLGTPQAIAGILHGANQALPFENFQVLMSAPQARQVAKGTPSAYNLLPSDKYFQNTINNVITFDVNSLPDWLSRYGTINTRSELADFMADTNRTMPSDDDIGTPTIVDPLMLNNTVGIHNELDDWVPSDGIELIVIAGWGNETVSQLEYSKKIIGCANSVKGICVEPVFSNQITFNPKVVLDGDGTVVESSAMWANDVPVTRYWLNLKGFNDTSILGLDRKKHANIFGMPQLGQLLSMFISDTPGPLPQYVSTSRPDYSGDLERLHFTLHSPLTLGFVDSSGHYTGLTATSTITSDSRVVYEKFGEVQWLSVPKSLAGQVIMRGTGSGSFALDIEEVNGNTTLAEATFAAIPSSTSTIATLSINPAYSQTQDGVLLVDQNGDGTTDLTLRARQGVIVLPDSVAPEALITVSTSTKDIFVNGIDESLTTIVKGATSTTVTDTAGNKTTLSFKRDYSGSLLTYARITGISYGTSTIPLLSSLIYVWDSSKTPVSQTVVVDKTFTIQALYDKKKDKTTIIVIRKNAPIETVVLSGLKLIKLTTSRGAVSYSW